MPYRKVYSASGHAYDRMQTIEVQENAPMAGRWLTLAMRQNQIMNYDAYYASYGEAGKYLYLQDMLAQSGQVFDASMMLFGEVTLWSSLTTEAVLLSQTSGFSLSADELALAGKSADDIVRLAKIEQSLELSQIDRGAIRYRKAPSHFDPGDIDLGQERTDQLFQKAAVIGNIDLWKYVDRVAYEPSLDAPEFFLTRGGKRVIHFDPASLSGSTENQLIRAFHEITHAQKCYHFVQRDFGGDFAAAFSAWEVLTKNKFVYGFDEVIAERMAIQRVEKYLGVLSRGQRAESYNEVIRPRRRVFWPDLP